MAESDKLYICASTGCNMSFTNEDQLLVHKKKHDMMLNLGNSTKNSGFVADQTPTPTRFIRNCEEVGLFQDLQNVNPFEETFRRAVEDGNTGTLSVPEAGITDDTLHTPHIFPHIADVLSANPQILSESTVQECTTGISITDKDTTVSHTSEQSLIKGVKLATHKDVILSDSIISHPVNIAPKVLPVETTPQLSINGEEVQLLLKTADGKLMQLSAIPIGESSGINQPVDRSKQQTVVIRTEPPLQCSSALEPKKPTVSRLSLAKMKLKQVLAKNSLPENEKPLDNNIKSGSCGSKKENRIRAIDVTKKRDILERNRASSMRARAKRKAWIQQLERTVTNVNETNVALQMEIKSLRAEVAKLKTLLLAHKDCPVTKAMQKGSGIVLGPKIISVNSDILTATTTLNTTLKRSGTIFQQSDVPVAPKKKPSPALMKNPPIFPKVDCSQSLPRLDPIPSTLSSTLIKSLPTLKIMNMNQFITEKDEAKQILIVQNPQRKLDATSPRQIIRINPNYELDHAASKSTGS